MKIDEPMKQQKLYVCQSDFDRLKLLKPDNKTQEWWDTWLEDCFEIIRPMRRHWFTRRWK